MSYINKFYKHLAFVQLRLTYPLHCSMLTVERAVPYRKLIAFAGGWTYM
ncbi:MAG: hypothetical protein J6U94_00720 [Paludibacteraceae bacterium]|nr:hypothetical protein [Paludibacteraceae bacterium]